MDSLEVLASVAEKKRARTRAISDEHNHLLYVHQHDMIDYIYRLKQNFNLDDRKGIHDFVVIGLAASDGTGDFLLHTKILKILRRIARTLTYVISFADATSGSNERNNFFRQQNMILYNRFKNQNEFQIDEYLDLPLHDINGASIALNNMLQYEFIQNLVNSKDAPYVIITSAFFYDDMMITYESNRAHYKPEARFLYLGECGINTYHTHLNSLPGVSLGFSKASIGMYYMLPEETKYNLNKVDNLFKKQKLFIFNHLKVSEDMYNDDIMSDSKQVVSESIDDKFKDEFNPDDVLYKLMILEIFIYISLNIHRGTLICLLPDEFDFSINTFMTVNGYIGMNFHGEEETSSGLMSYVIVSNTDPNQVYTIINLYGRLEKDNFNYLMYHSHYFAGVTGHNTFLHALSIHKIPLYDCLRHSVPCFEGFTEFVYRYVKHSRHVPKISDAYEAHTNIYYVLDRYICTNGRAPTIFDYVTPFNLNAAQCIRLFNHIFQHGILIEKYNIDHNLPIVVGVGGGSGAARALRHPPTTP